MEGWVEEGGNRPAERNVLYPKFSGGYAGRRGQGLHLFLYWSMLKNRSNVVLNVICVLCLLACSVTAHSCGGVWNC